MLREDLLQDLAEIVAAAHSDAIGILAESGFDQLYKKQLKVDVTKRVERRFCERANEILEKVESAGYSVPPKGDLRAQLLRVARELKACTFSSGYSGDNDVEERIAEAKADVKSDIGITLLNALMGE
jgi:hypothetical protein